MNIKDRENEKKCLEQIRIVSNKKSTNLNGVAYVCKQGRKMIIINIKAKKQEIQCHYLETLNTFL